MKQIRLFKPWVGEEELESIRKAFDRGWIGLGPVVEEFENNWSEYMKGGNSIALNSCTAALDLALKIFDFPENKKVLVSSITFVSTAHAVLYNGLVPIFVDVDKNTLQMSTEDLERKITDDCVAVMPVHYGGHPCDMEAILEIAKKNNLKVIEDCANTAGGEINGHKLGSLGDIGCFSFEEKKNMTTGDGGMLFTKDKALAEKARSIRWCGIDKDTWRRLKKQETGINDPYHWHYEVSELGYKYNMNDLAASIGLVQLNKLDNMNKMRSKLIQRYMSKINFSNNISSALPYEFPSNSYWLYMVKVQDRNSFIVHLKKQGVSTGVHFMPLTLHPLYAKFDSLIPNAMAVWENLVTLPLYPELSFSDQDYVIDVVNSYSGD